MNMMGVLRGQLDGLRARANGTNGTNGHSDPAMLARRVAELERRLADRDAELTAKDEQLQAAEKQVGRLTTFRANITKQLVEMAERLALSESIVHAIPEPLLVVGMDGVAEYANAALCAITGLEREEIEGKLRGPDLWSHPAGVVPAIDRCLQAEKPITGEHTRIVTRTGVAMELVASAAPRRTSVGDLKGAFAIFRDVTREAALTRSLVEAGERISEVHASAAQILAAAQEQGATATEQAATVAQVTTTATELAASAQQVAASCGTIAESTAHLLDASRTGRSVLGDVVRSMHTLKEMSTEASDQVFRLGERSKRIDAVVDLIGKVAAETKLIAFNAAIEAARAGEAGRGFSVVASEVKSLAESVARSSTEIKTMVGDIHTSINRTVLSTEGQMKVMAGVAEHAHSSEQVFGELVGEIEDVVEQTRSISVAANEQRSATDMLTTSMGEVSRAANHSATAARETIGAVSQLTDFARTFAAAQSRFKAGQ